MDLALLSMWSGFGPAGLRSMAVKALHIQQFADQTFFVQLNHRCGNTAEGEVGANIALRILSSRKRVTASEAPPVPVCMEKPSLK